MCWVGKCDVKIAKRDFYVYKIGLIKVLIVCIKTLFIYQEY